MWNDSRRRAARCASAAPSPCLLCLLLRPLRAAATQQRGAEGSPPVGAWLILMGSGCPAAGGLCYCGAHGEIRLQGSACQRCTRGAVLCMRGGIERAHLHCSHKAALHIWGCFSHVGLHSKCRKLLWVCTLAQGTLGGHLGGVPPGETGQHLASHGP